MNKKAAVIAGRLNSELTELNRVADNYRYTCKT